MDGDGPIIPPHNPTTLKTPEHPPYLSNRRHQRRPAYVRGGAPRVDALLLRLLLLTLTPFLRSGGGGGCRRW